MNFSSFFGIEKNLNLDKKTLVILRWIAIFGQLFAIYLVHFFLKFSLPIFLCTLVLFVGILTNFYLQFIYKKNEINNLFSSIILHFDLIQLTALLFLTGGITNPFVIFLIIPCIVSSTLLNLGSTIMLTVSTIILLGFLTFFHFPLPHPGSLHFHVPNYYLYAVPISILIALIFLTYFSARFGLVSRKKTEALSKLELLIAKEKELETIGLQAAAAVHSLGTPLSTITVIAKELKKDIKDNNKYAKDIELLLSQARRCSEILKKISKSQIEDDKFISKITMRSLIEEIISSFKEISGKKIILNTDNENTEITINRSAEIIFGIRNFFGNAVKFSKNEVNINLEATAEKIILKISDDGPGFPDDLNNLIGQPYISSNSKKLSSKSGLGLGTFIGKTLLERNKAILNFSNQKKGGALVEIVWKTSDIKA